MCTYKAISFTLCIPSEFFRKNFFFKPTKAYIYIYIYTYIYIYIYIYIYMYIHVITVLLRDEKIFTNIIFIKLYAGLPGRFFLQANQELWCMCSQ